MNNCKCNFRGAILVIAALMFMGNHAFGGSSNGTKVFLTVGRQTSYTGKWNPPKSNTAEKRFIDVRAGVTKDNKQVELQEDAAVQPDSLATRVRISPNGKASAYATCTMLTGAKHKTHIKGTFKVPGTTVTTGTGGGGLPEWDATGLDFICNHEKLDVEVDANAGHGITNDFQKYGGEKGVKDHLFSVPCVKGKFFRDVKDASEWWTDPADGKKYLGYFQSIYPQFNDFPEDESYPAGTECKRTSLNAVCPLCNRKTMIQVEITVDMSETLEPFIELCMWKEYKNKKPTKPGPEARLAWQEFYKNFLDHEFGHKDKYDKEFIAKLKDIYKAFNAQTFRGEACYASPSVTPQEAQDRAVEIARAKLETEYNKFKTAVEKLETDIKKSQKKYDKDTDHGSKSDKSPGMAPLLTVPIDLIVPKFDTKRWEEEIKGSISKRANTGYNFYDPKVKWSIKDKPKWLTFDDKTGELSGTPKPKYASGKKKDGKYTFYVKLEETLDGEKIFKVAEVKMTIKSWTPIIEVATKTVKIRVGRKKSKKTVNVAQITYTVKKNTGIPLAKNPEYQWAYGGTGLGMTVTGKGTATYVLTLKDQRYVIAGQKERINKYSTLKQRISGFSTNTVTSKPTYFIKNKKK